MKPGSITLLLILNLCEYSKGYVTWKVPIEHSRTGLSRGMTATDGSIRKSIQYGGDDSNILEDRSGHINRELAERIWNWEQERRQASQLPKIRYSVRSGLRLVDKLAREALESRPLQQKHDTSVYSDLVQEGLVALLDAMSHYRDEENQSDDFEAYARQQIRNQLSNALEDKTRPMRLPKAIRDIVEEVREMSVLLQKETGRKPTVKEIAARLGVATGNLKEYLRVAQRRTVSVESTVEVVHPSLDDYTYEDQDEWELRQGLVLDDGKAVNRDENVEDYLDEMQKLEGDDEAWVHESQIAGPLQELIPDTSEPDPDEVYLLEMIRHDLNDFLVSTLEPNEVNAIRLAFGLDTVNPLPMRQIASEMKISSAEVSRLLTSAINKLRASYKDRFVETQADDDDEPFDIVDSV